VIKHIEITPAPPQTAAAIGLTALPTRYPPASPDISAPYAESCPGRFDGCRSAARLQAWLIASISVLRHAPRGAHINRIFFSIARLRIRNFISSKKFSRHQTSSCPRRLIRNPLPARVFAAAPCNQLGADACQIDRRFQPTPCTAGHRPKPRAPAVSNTLARRRKQLAGLRRPSGILQLYAASSVGTSSIATQALLGKSIDRHFTGTGLGHRAWNLSCVAHRTTNRDRPPAPTCTRLHLPRARTMRSRVSDARRHL